MKVIEWFKKNTYSSEQFSDISMLTKKKRKEKLKVSCVIPTLNEEDNIANVVKEAMKLMKRKFLDEVLVIDSGSNDNTQREAEKAGATFVAAKDILKKYGDKRGKGENLWKSLYVTTGDIIAWVDADIKNISTKFIYGIVGPLIKNSQLDFAKAFYRRPIRIGNDLNPMGGGRVTEILVRPLFNMHFPRLSGFIQPLSGEYAGRRNALEKIPFFTGYGVETGMLIDLEKMIGLKKMAQVDLTTRIHRNQPLENLSRMSFEILQAFFERASAFGSIAQLEEINETYTKIDSMIRGKQRKYSLNTSIIKEWQRPPMISLPEYRKKFRIKENELFTQ